MNLKKSLGPYVLKWLIHDGVVKTLHPESHRLAYLVRCYYFSIITTYLMYAEIKEKLHASNMKLFTYPSNIKVFTSLLIHEKNKPSTSSNSGC